MSKHTFGYAHGTDEAEARGDAIGKAIDAGFIYEDDSYDVEVVQNGFSVVIRTNKEMDDSEVSAG